MAVTKKRDRNANSRARGALKPFTSISISSIDENARKAAIISAVRLPPWTAAWHTAGFSPPIALHPVPQFVRALAAVARLLEERRPLLELLQREPRRQPCLPGERLHDFRALQRAAIQRTAGDDARDLYRFPVSHFRVYLFCLSPAEPPVLVDLGEQPLRDIGVAHVERDVEHAQRPALHAHGPDHKLLHYVHSARVAVHRRHERYAQVG